MINSLIYFKNRLINENTKQNLISRKTTLNEIDIHIEDSLKLFEFIDIQKEKILDIGSGAGFPGLILGIVSRETNITLLESDLKKSVFLEETKNKMGLNNITILRERAEIAGKDLKYREKFTLVTSRAVASTRVMIEYAAPFLKVGGILLLWKGPKAEEEINEAEDALKILNIELKEKYKYSLGENERYIIKFIKKASTPAKYPRRVGIPTKRPL